MSDSVRPHRRQPTRLPRPWDSPGKNTGVGCHFLLQCMKVKRESEVSQSCLTLHDPMDCSLPGSSVHGIFQARVLEWIAIAFLLLIKLQMLSRYLFLEIALHSKQDVYIWESPSWQAKTWSHETGWNEGIGMERNRGLRTKINSTPKKKIRWIWWNQ